MMKTVATFLVSYDAELLKTSLPLVYPHVDRLVLAVDRDRRTWSGNRFSLPDDLMDWLQAADVQRKVSVYEDSFFVPGRAPLDLDSRQRQMAAEYAGVENTWQIQIDADEYVLNCGDLMRALREEERRGAVEDDVMYMGNWISLFKQDEIGFFFVDNDGDYEKTAIAASRPRFRAARTTGSMTRRPLDVFLVHQTFARGEADLRHKMLNWSHAGDFNAESYLALWKAVDRDNYRMLANFHPRYPVAWRRLNYLEAGTAEEFVESYRSILAERLERESAERRRRANPILRARRWAAMKGRALLRRLGEPA